MYAMYFVAVGSLAALLFAASMFAKVKKQPEGNSEMIRISTAVREGANAYLKRQYKGIGIFFAVMFVILLVMAFSGLLGFFTPFAFLTGGFFSGLSGFIGMRTATMANCRTAEGASHSLNRGLKVAFSAGSVMGFTVVGLGLLDITIWYTILNVWRCLPVWAAVSLQKPLTSVPTLSVRLRRVSRKMIRVTRPLSQIT